MIKNLYIGRFMFRSKVKILRCMAASEKQARVIFCNRIAKEQGVHPSWVFQKFPDTSNIETEVEYAEHD